MKKQDIHIYLWHDCLDCSYLAAEDCPLKGNSEAARILDRVNKPESFRCTRFLENREN